MRLGPSGDQEADLQDEEAEAVEEHDDVVAPPPEPVAEVQVSTPDPEPVVVAAEEHPEPTASLVEAVPEESPEPPVEAAPEEVFVREPFRGPPRPALRVKPEPQKTAETPQNSEEFENYVPAILQL